MGKLGSRSYSANASDYRLLEEVGYGASATVYRAIYIPLNEVVAVKRLDLDRCNCNLDDVRREAQTMSLIDHPNVVSAYCSFIVEHNLWVVMPFMAEGSCLHLMKIAYPDGFEEVAIGAILKETLRALQYLHQHGHIHRDVKAGNILLDTNGMVKLADFGVSACMFDAGDRQRSRNTFVGTPCWMAPEVLQPGSGYTSKADIWSFGITALELAHGHAPFSKHPPMKVLLMTIQNAPPGLDYDRDKKFSKSFKEMVAMCLVKDQTKRPTAEKLLKHSFFKLVKAPEIIVKKLFTDLPPLWNRVKALQHKDSAQLALKKMPSSEEEAISQNEYKRGVSAWNFDVEDLMDQASLVQDDEDFSETKEDVNIKSLDPSCPQSTLAESISSSEIHGRENGNAESRLPQPHRLCSKPGSQTCVGPYASSQDPERSGSSIELMPSTSESDIVPTKTRTSLMKGRQTQSGPLVPRVMLAHSFSEKGMASERCEYECLPTTEKASQDVQRPSSFSGPLMLPKRASANSFSAPIKSSGGYRDSLDDRSKANFIQIKGRFSVTSENVDLVKDIPLCTASRKSSQGSPLRKSASVGNWITETKLMSRSQRHKDCGNSDVHSSLLMSHLHNLFQQTSVQQDLIVNLLTCLQPPLIPDALQSGKLPPLPGSPESNEAASFPVEMDASERERQLLIKISELHSRMYGLSEELNAEKLKFKQLQQQLDAISSGEYEDRGGEP